MFLSYSSHSLWQNLSWSSRFFCLVLFVAGLYTLATAVRATLRLRSMRNENLASAQSSLTTLQSRMANVRQALGAAFYLFGLVFFLNLPDISNYADNSRTPGWVYIERNFVFLCAFAANAMLVFLILHLTQWFVTRQINSRSKRLMSQ